MELKNISRLLENSFNGHAWHGPSVMEALQDISSETAHRKSATSHSIIELIMHMTAWRNFVIKRLTGDDLYEMTEEDNFPKPIELSQAMEKLLLSQSELKASLNRFSDKRLTEIVAGRKYDFYTLLHGIIQHDIYHTGQIILLKK